MQIKWGKDKKIDLEVLRINLEPFDKIERKPKLNQNKYVLINQETIQELDHLQKHRPPNCRVSLKDDDNIREWRATMIGSTGTPHDGGVFKLSIFLSFDYPHFEAIVRLDTRRTYHCNVSDGGAVYLWHFVFL